MSKGRRYNSNGELNYKKVIAVIIALIVLILGIIMVKKLIITSKNNKISDKKINYFALYENNLWGIIDSNGNKVIEPMYQEMMIVINKEKDIFLCTYDVNEESGTYKTKVVNKKNEMIFTNYGKVEAIENTDSSGNLWYEEDILKIYKDGKYGLINLNGEEIVSPMYDEITALSGVKNSLIVKQNEKYGIINNKGNLLIEPKYNQITSLDNENYENGYITLDENGKYGLIDINGQVILENNYEKIDNIYKNNYYVIEEAGKQKIVNDRRNN